MRTKKLLAAASCLTLLGLLATTCAPGAPQPPTAKPAAPVPKTQSPAAESAASSAAPSPTSKPAVEEPRYGGILSFSSSADPPNFDIHQATQIVVLEPLAPCYSGLLQYDPIEPTKIVGDLAKSWETSPDGKAFIFRLQSGVTWHDGKPFTSEDALYSLQRMWAPPKGVISARKEQFIPVEKIEAPDASTIKITMQYPYLSFIAQFATDWFVILPKHVLEAKGDMKRDVVGTGPFKFQSYSPGASIRLVKNPEYFVKGRPYLDGMEIYIIRDAAARFAAFRTGRIKMVGRSPALTATQSDIIRKDHPNIRLSEYPAMQCPWFHFNCAVPPFNDVRVRKAVSLAFDRQAAIKSIVQGMASLGTFLPQGEWSIPESEVIKLPGYRQPKAADVAEARKLLSEAGYSKGLKIPLLTREDQTRAAEFMAAQLAPIGIDVTIEVAETGAHSQRMESHSYIFGLQSNTNRINDPDEFARKWLDGAAQNYMQWKNEKFERLFVEQSQTQDVAKRKAMVRELDEILLEEWPSLLPYWAYRIIGTWAEVRNYVPPAGMYSSLKNQEIWLSR